jgi:phenylacetic acid degradation protein paaN
MEEMVDTTLQQRLQSLAEKMEKASEAIYERAYFSVFEENPSPKFYGETADADGKAEFEAMLGKPFEGLLQDTEGASYKGVEVSPYTGKALGITYPALDPNALVAKAIEAQLEWEIVAPDDRIGLLMMALLEFEKSFFTIAHATMHVTGQGFMMAFQAGAPHAADRAAEAVTLAGQQLGNWEVVSEWRKPMGKTEIALHKEYIVIPHGISLALGCSTFPTWNSLPGIFASLAVGSPVIVKPHPLAILPLAIAVRCIQRALVEAGLSPEICQLAVDTVEEPIAKHLAEQPKVKIIDYTGGSSFGNYLETLPGKVLFTEKAGINVAIVAQADDLNAVVQNLAFSVCLYSGQMCTAPHHIMVPAEGVTTPAGKIAPADFAKALAEAINALSTNPKAGPFVLGAIQNPATLERLKTTGQAGEEILAGAAIAHPMFEGARMLSPSVRLVTQNPEAAITEELFGPTVLVLVLPTIEAAIHLTASVAEEKGAISGAIYMDEADDRFVDYVHSLNRVGIPVSVNLTGPIYMNQNAAFSDMHVTGGNPAGNGSIGSPDFISRRFFVVGNKYVIKGE